MKNRFHHNPRQKGKREREKREEREKKEKSGLFLRKIFKL